MIPEFQAKEIMAFLEWFEKKGELLPALDQWDSSQYNPLKKKSLEFVFANAFVTPLLREYFLGSDFLEKHNLTIEVARTGLAIEYQNRVKDGHSSPQRKSPFLLSKAEIFKNRAPAGWFEASEKSRPKLAPDFAINSPLPMDVVGELKVFKSGGRMAAETAIYSAIREAIFYMGAFCGEFKGAIIIFADLSEGQELAELWKQFCQNMDHVMGAMSGIFGCVVSVKRNGDKASLLTE